MDWQFRLQSIEKIWWPWAGASWDLFTACSEAPELSFTSSHPLPRARTSGLFSKSVWGFLGNEWKCSRPLRPWLRRAHHHFLLSLLNTTCHGVKLSSALHVKLQSQSWWVNVYNYSHLKQSAYSSLTQIPENSACRIS